MVALILSPLPIIGAPILHLAESYTNPLLNMIFYGVDLLEGGLWSAHIHIDLLFSLLISILLLGFWLDERRYHLSLSQAWDP